MRVLIAEDDAVSRLLLQKALAKWGYEVVAVRDGVEAEAALNAHDRPPLAIMDRMMPGVDGLSLVRGMRRNPSLPLIYAILLTAMGSKEDIVAGLEAGADDYVAKPFNLDELHARVRVGERIITLQTALAERIRELERAKDHIHTLQGILPMCMYCKRVRSGSDYWQQVETYLSQHSEAAFTHGICPECNKRYVDAELARLVKPA